MDIKSILVPTDFSADSRLALEHALDLAQQSRAVIHVMHVIELPLFPAYPGLSMSDAWPNLHEDNARRGMEKFLEGVDYEPLETFVEAGHAPDLIVDYATEKDVDLIVIATHGRRGLAHLLMGSTTERVIRITNCPVLVIRHPDRRLEPRERKSSEQRATKPAEPASWATE